MAIPQTNVDYLWNSVVNPRLGVAPYAWGGSFDGNDPTVGTDCSGAVSAALEALLYGPAMTYLRQFYTGTFAGAQPGDVGPFGGIAVTSGLVCIASPDDAPPDAVMIIAVRQEADPTDAHMICQVGGVTIEMGGNEYLPNGIEQDYHINPPDTNCNSISDTSVFNQWFYQPGPIFTTQQGLDYAGGRPTGRDIAAAGFGFVCRYVTDGGSGLPQKELTEAEAEDLQGAGLGIVSNFESTGTDATAGFNQGVADAQQGNANHLAAGGPPDRPIYFSLDWDEAPTDDAAVDAYFQGVASVITLARTGAYGGYWPLSRLLDAGLISWAWQAEAWSGDPNQLPPAGPDEVYLDPRANILQRNALGTVTIDGVQCDENISYSDDFGQWNYTGDDDFMSALSDAQQLDFYTKIEQLWGAAFNQITSQSPFRELGEEAIWQQHQLPINDDGFIQPMYAAWAAAQGDPVSLAGIEAVAAGDPSQYPDRVQDIKLAQAVLASITAGAVITPIPVPAVVTPDMPDVPVPAPTPAAPSKNPLKSTPMSYLHTITSIVGGGVAVGSWVVAHNIFSAPIAAGISSVVVAATGLFNYLVKEETTLEGN